MAQSKGEKMNRNRPQGRRNSRSPDKTLKNCPKDTQRTKGSCGKQSRWTMYGQSTNANEETESMSVSGEPRAGSVAAETARPPESHSRLRQAEESVDLVTEQWKRSSPRNRKKNNRSQWTESKGPIRYSQDDQHTRYGNLRRKRKRKGQRDYFKK